MRKNYHSLRQEAENKVARKQRTWSQDKAGDALLHELRVHQIQLEMQNEDLQRTQKLLAESRNRYIELYDFSPVGYLTLSLEGTITQINPTGADLLGQAREALLKRQIKTFVSPECHQHIDHLLRNAIDQGERTVAELMFKRLDGSVFDAELIYRRIKPDDGPPVIHIAITDVSERKQNELQLRIAATAFESQEGMLIMNTEPVILKVNRAFNQITGYSTDEAIGGSISLLDAGYHAPAFYLALWECVARDGFWQGEIWSQRKNGETFPAWFTISVVRGSNGEITHYVATITDHTLRKAEEEKIKHLAYYDSLTQLPNRQFLLSRLQQALALSIRSGREGALLFIDLDNFKALNDTLGHDMGDLLLQQVAQRLNTCIREGDTVARLGGDEFVVMLEDLSPNLQEAADQIEAVGEKILDTLNNIYDLDGHPYHSTPSIGATLFHGHADSVPELLKSADLAMYHAKAAGRNALRFFDPEMQAAVNARINLEEELRRALQNGQFTLHYQAQVDNEGYMIGAEALLRWQHPIRGLLSPEQFISSAEDTGLIVPLGQWALNAACQQLADWAVTEDMAHMNLGLNISPRQFRQIDFVSQVSSTLNDTGANPHKLCFELTESVFGQNLDDCVAKMSALKSLGTRFAIDNFGHGKCSLSYLKTLPLDQLKIGHPFVQGIADSQCDAAIVKSIVTLGQALGVSVIAEGVETVKQLKALRQADCQTFQGFLYGRPGTAETLRKMQMH